MPAEGERYNPDEAREEASGMQEKIRSNEARNYAEAESIVDSENKEEKTEKAVDPEKEKPIMVTFVYRGTNPYLRALATGLKEAGMNVRTIEVPIGTDEEVIGDAEKLGEVIGSLEGNVVTDETLIGTVYQIVGERTISAYHLRPSSEIRTVEDVKDKVGPIVEEIRAKGREPVILRCAIDDHVNNDRFPREGSGRGFPLSYSQLISKECGGVPEIEREEFGWHYSGSPSGNLAKVIEKRGIDPQKAVVLVDHHIYNIKGANIKKAGLDELEIVPICSCCIAKGGEFSVNLENRGFKVFPIEYGEDKHTMEATEILAKELRERANT